MVIVNFDCIWYLMLFSYGNYSPETQGAYSEDSLLENTSNLRGVCAYSFYIVWGNYICRSFCPGLDVSSQLIILEDFLIFTRGFFFAIHR